MRTTVELIKEYKDMYDKGALSQQEYDFLKDNLLSQGNKEFEEDKDIQIREEAVAHARAERKEEISGNIGIIIGVVIMILIVGLFVKGCEALWSLVSSSTPDYTTYYIDENGNGELDQGEGNYTEDEDGNIVDTDEDGNNFEFD